MSPVVRIAEFLTWNGLLRLLQFMMKLWYGSWKIWSLVWLRFIMQITFFIKHIFQNFYRV